MNVPARMERLATCGMRVMRVRRVEATRIPGITTVGIRRRIPPRNHFWQWHPINQQLQHDPLQRGYPAYPGTPDPQFNNRPCTPYAFRNGVETSVCYDPDPNNHYLLTSGSPDPNGLPDSPPAESDQQCGDYWTFPLHLTTEWQLFLVPFTTMYQQGWAKRWPFFDISSVSVVRLTWDAGWVDYWIDNLRFYRVRH